MDETNRTTAQRFVSLDIFRGLIMFLLVAETAGVYSALRGLTADDTAWHVLFEQFHHHPWHGLRFWDLVQPYFMFIVGVAMAMSATKRSAAGQSWSDLFRHTFVRCLLLLMFGVGLHCIYARELRWELWNVLSQLSVTILIAFLIMRWSAVVQIAVSFALILLTDILYRFWPVEGYDQPFVKGENFGAWMDMLLMGKINSDGWVAVNCLPTAAHTIWGVVAGQLLIGESLPRRILGLLLMCGSLLLVVGYGLDAAGASPIIKRICTSSFVIVTGGWCLITLALLYWLVDIAGLQRWGFVFVVVGMNPIFIYLLSETLGQQWLNDTVTIFTDGALSLFSTNKNALRVASALAVFALEWWLCLWLYRRKIFIKI